MAGIRNNSVVRLIAAVTSAAFLASCAGHGVTPKTSSFAIPATPQSVSPAKIPVTPMSTARGPAMQASAIKPMDAIGPANWNPIPGTGSFVAAAQDGSLWVLSDQPAGPDKFIYHYVNGVFTQIAGQASRLAVAPDGTLYAINSGGGAYQYNTGTGTFAPLGGGCSDITVAADGSVYVLSNGGAPGTDQAIWHYVNGTWTQAGGSGVRIAGNWDTQTYTLNNSGGTIAPGGIYILNSAGNIYYENTSAAFALVPGSASAIAPTKNAGIFVLSYPSTGSDNAVFYFDLDAQNYSQPGGSAVSLSTNTTFVYAASSSNNLYYSLVTTTQGSIPTSFINNSGITPAYFTLTGQNPNDRSDNSYYHVTATGQVVKIATSDITFSGSNPIGTADYNIPFPAPGQTFPIPLLRAARMYISLGTKFMTQVNRDLVWQPSNGWSYSGDPNYKTLWDNFEFDYVVSPDSHQPGMGFNITNVQMFGLPFQFSLTSASGSTQSVGFVAGSRTAIMNALSADANFSSVLVPGPATGTSVSPIRAISMDQAIINKRDNLAGVPQFSNPAYFDTYISGVWSYFKTHTLTAITSAFGTYTGTVNGSNQLVFSQAGKPDVVFALPPTTDLIVGGGSVIDMACAPWPNPVDPLRIACNELRSMLSAGINRSTLPTATFAGGGSTMYRNPPCPMPFLNAFYQGTPDNLYSKLIHQYSLPQSPFAPGGAAYGFGFDDNCNQAAILIDNNNPKAMSITIGSF